MLRVKDLMTDIPAVVSPTTSLRRVVELMKAEGCRQLPVLDKGELVGIITDRDVRLVVRAPATLTEAREDMAVLESVSAEMCMTANPLAVSPEMPAFKAADLLSSYKFGALPVVDDGLLVGILSVTDFLKHFASETTPMDPSDSDEPTGS